MNIEKAKEILSSIHFEDVRPDDREAIEAIEMATSNPELMRWMHEQQDLDPSIQKALQSAPVPGNLEEDLLAAVSSGKPSAHRGSNIRPWLYAAAAIFTIGFVSIFLHKNEDIVQGIQRQVSGKDQNNYADFRDGMAYYIASVYFQLDHLTTNLGSIENWLQEKKAPHYDELPDELIALNPIGCKELSWRGDKVSLVCFHSDDGGIIHLFIMDRSGADFTQYADIGEIAMSHGLETGGWVTNDRIYVLVGSDPEVDIEFALSSKA